MGGESLGTPKRDYVIYARPLKKVFLWHNSSGWLKAGFLVDKRSVEKSDYTFQIDLTQANCKSH